MNFPILSVSDFPMLVLNTEQESDLTTLILEKEKEYTREILSDQAYIDILATTTEAKYTELFNGVTWVDSDSKNKVNTGFKNVLKNFILSHWIYTQYQYGVTGLTKNQNENSTNAADAVNTGLVYKAYNDGLKIYYNEILPFISEKTNETGYEGYEDFNLPDLDFLFA